MTSSDISNEHGLGLFRKHAALEGRVFVIGDIHGCVKELGFLLGMLVQTVNTSDCVIFIGDYIDRGLNSAQVIGLLQQFKKDHHNTIFLKGNHEAMLLEFIDGKRSMESRYLNYGGKETFTSYKLSPMEIFEDLECGIPTGDVKFFRDLELGIHAGQYLITHAGIKPSIPIHEQSEAELLWVREGFINNPHPWPYTIIYGHTPVKDVELNLPYRIGIDTGLVYGNMLSCIELREGTKHQIKLGSDRVKHSSL